MKINKSFFVVFVLLLLCLPLQAYADAAASESVVQENTADEQGGAMVMSAFDNDRSAKSELVAIEDQTKRLVMFFMGFPLLLLIFATVSLGIAMVVYGKPVFVAHMVCAGLSLTLAMGHAVVGIVWFFPF